jgi:hypothetical protein
MADKRKAATRKPTPRASGTKTRRAPAAAGRIARARETFESRPVALDEHSVRVREEIDAALGEALRMREDITQRIESGLMAEPPRRPALPVSRSRVSRR